MASSSSSGLTFKVHPLVIVNISDHYTRIKCQMNPPNSNNPNKDSNNSGAPRVYGCVIGVQKGRTVEIFNSFELLYDPSTQTLDRAFLEKKQELYKKVFPHFYILGWYSTGTHALESDMHIHKALMDINESPVFVLLNPSINHSQKDLPVTIYESELHVIDGIPQLIFVRSSYTIETVEAERISVDHVAHLKPSDGGSAATQLAAHLTGIHSAIKMLHSRIKVTPRLEELQLFRIQQESKALEENENHPKRNARDKRKLGSQTSDEQSATKRQRDVGGIPKKAPEGNNYQLLKSSQVTKLEVANQNNNISDDNLSEQQSTPGKSMAYSDQCTAFISNLHPTANYEHIRNFFSDVGGVVAIRILHDKFTGKSRGLAYVDFLDDEHLAAAVAKNKQSLLGKKLSIARSEPKRGRMDSSAPKSLKEHAHASDLSSQKGCVSKETDGSSKGDVKDARFSSRKPGSDNIQLKGKNTFAVPRNVRPLGFTANKPKAQEVDEKPKSNDEFRKMFIR